MIEQSHDRRDDVVDTDAPEPASVNHDWANETAQALAADDNDSRLNGPEESHPVTLDSPDTSAARRRSNAASANRTLIRRAIAKFEELYETHDLGLLPPVFGVNGTDVAELTVAVLSATQKDLRVLADATAVLEADPVEAGVVAAAFGRSRLRHVWKLFAYAGVVSGDLPASDAKAAIALARALHNPDAPGVQHKFDRTTELLRKN